MQVKECVTQEHKGNESIFLVRIRGDHDISYQLKLNISLHCHAIQAPIIDYMELPLAELMERSLNLSSFTSANQVGLRPSNNRKRDT